MARIKDYSDLRYIKRLKAKNKYKAIEELAQVFKGSREVGNVKELIGALIERERIMSTGIGFGIAIPHAKIKSVSKIAFAIGISKNGIDFDSLDGKPVHLIILVAAGEKQHKDYLRLLSRIMSIVREESIRNSIINSRTNAEIIGIFDVDMEA